MEFLENILYYNENAPLFFSQLYFWGFFFFVLVFYSLVYKHNSLRIIYLTIVSIFFYYKSGGYFFTLLLFSTITDYILGLLIYKTNSSLGKKIFLFISILINLGILSYFKYAYFFTEVFNQIFNTNVQVVNLLALWTNSISGTHFDISTIVLPVGISFYTFQTMSYIIDVYRGRLKPVRNIMQFCFYVTFFPQLVAGPIVRAAEFIPQLFKTYQLTREQMWHAIFLILNGLMKKMIISDYISINFVDRVFDAPLSYSGFENLMALYGYSIQIYCDFSGYTDIAIGIGILLGFRFPLNFNSPYKAINITDFWRRWHISLSTWLRDYLYFSLGGNRKGKFRTYINLMITMILGGLWHGANIRFIIWGALHGVALAIHKMWLSWFPPKPKISRFTRIVSVFFTFHFVSFAWIFFRCDSMQNVSNMMNQLIYNFNFYLIPQMLLSYWVIFSMLIIVFVIHWLPNTIKEYYRGTFIRMPYLLKIVTVIIIVFIIYQTKSSELQPFIYFKF